MRRSTPRAPRGSAQRPRPRVGRRRPTTIEALEARQLLTYTLQILHASDLEGGVDAFKLRYQKYGF